MRCTEARLHLSAYLDRELSPRRAQAVRAHLERCPRCRAIYREYAANQRQLAETLRTAPYLPVAGRVRAAARQERRTARPSGPSWLTRGGERLLAGAALLALLALVTASALAIRGAGQRRAAPSTTIAQSVSSSVVGAGSSVVATQAAIAPPTSALKATIAPTVASIAGYGAAGTAAPVSTATPTPADPKLMALQSAAGFTLYAPTWLPEGVTLASTEPVKQLPGFVSLNLPYRDAAGGPAFDVTEAAPYKETRDTMPSAIYDASVEVDLGNGMTARYYDGGNGRQQLWWQAGPVAIRLDTDALPKDQLLRIARAMAPLPAEEASASPTPAATPGTLDQARALGRRLIVTLGGNPDAQPTATRVTTLGEPHALGLPTAPDADLKTPVWWMEYADALVPAGCPGISASLCQHGQLVVIVTASEPRILGWQGADGAWKTAAGTTSPAATPVSDTAPQPLAQAGAVWDRVARGVGDSIDPVLRPGALPDGFQTIQIANLAPGAFSVAYSGPGQELQIGVAGWNPPLCGTGCTQSRVIVRGQPATLQVNDAGADPAGQVWLWWSEPGTWTSSGLNQPTGIFYLISTHGLTPEQVQSIAASLSPLAAP